MLKLSFDLIVTFIRLMWIDQSKLSINFFKETTISQPLQGRQTYCKEKSTVELDKAHNRISKSICDKRVKNEIEEEVMGFIEKLNTDYSNFTKYIKEFEAYFFNIKC